MDVNAPEFLTPAELAARLRVSVATVRRRCADGSIPATRVGRQYRIQVGYLAARPVVYELPNPEPRPGGGE